MPVNFDWDFEREDPSEQSEGFSAPGGRRRRWRVWAAALFVLLLVSGLGVRVWYSNRLDRLAKIESELRDVVLLELQGIREGDVELFGLVQDPSAPRWRSQQVSRYINGSASYFAPAPGLIPAPRPARIEQVRVFGSLGRVRLLQWFYSPQPLSSPGSFLESWFQDAVPLPFQVIWFYRWDEQDGWYHTPPPSEHVGVDYTWYGDWMDLYATKSESELLDGVVRDVFGVVSDACELLECPAAEHYVLSLDDAAAPQVYGDRWRLPSLYLTGQPHGQVARAAWLQAFELWTVEALAESRVGGGVQERVLYQRLLLRLQVELGLIEPPAFDVAALAQAFNDSEGYSLQYLWDAEYVPGDVQGNLLLETKIDAFLYWVEEMVGPERTIELLSALRNYRNLNVALRSLYLIPSVNLQQDWLAYLQSVTGLVSLPLPVSEAPYQALPEPSLPGPPAVLPGDQLAFICDGRVWVSNADGSGLVPLTAAGENFEYLDWSPDGRWLLTVWQHSVWDSALYLVSSDGRGGRLLTDQPAQRIYPIGWSPDSSQVLYYVVSNSGGGADIRATRLEGGDTRLLFNQPTWSPDGQWAAQVQLPYNEQLGVWLSDADGANSRKIVDRATLGMKAWSPDGSQLALTLAAAGPTQEAIALYDLASGDLSPLLTIAEVTEIISPSHLAARGRNLIGGGVNPSTLDYFPLQSLWSQGWSADGSRIAIRAQSAAPMPVGSPASLLVAPLDGSPPRVLALSQGACALNRAVWSPTDPNLLLFNWPSAASPDVCHTYLFDLRTGPVYTATQEQVAAWSPDGERVALARTRVSVLDQEGRALADLGDGHCSAVAWNPRADLSAPTRTLTLSLGKVEADWSFENVRVYQGQDRALHVWGEVVNHSGSARRINSLLPLYIENGDGRSFAVETSFALTPPYQEMFNSASLEDGQGLPFNFELYLPDDARLVGAAQLVVQLDLNPNDQEPNRADLFISTEGLELSGELDSLRVSGSWENPGPALGDSAVIVVTVYGRDGKVLGWGWQSQTASYQLAAGRHDFAVDIALADLTDRGQLYSYKVQLLAR